MLLLLIIFCHEIRYTGLFTKVIFCHDTTIATLVFFSCKCDLISCKLSITHSADAYTCGIVVFDSVNLLAMVLRMTVFGMSLYLVRGMEDSAEETGFDLSINNDIPK